jgi:predicted transcriptional regulator
MAKTLTISIKSWDESAAEFRDTFKAVQAGRRVKRHDGVYFTSLEAARNLLTPSRVALLRAIRRERPGSIYQLAKLVRRDLKNVQDDLRLLETYGLVRMTRAKSIGKRSVKIPEAKFDAIALEIAI